MKRQFRKRVIALTLALLMVAEAFTSNLGGAGLFGKSGVAYAEGTYNFIITQPANGSIKTYVDDEEVTSANAGDSVTVKFAANYGYTISPEYERADGDFFSDMTFETTDPRYLTARFTMPASNVILGAICTAYPALPASGSPVSGATTYTFTPSETGKYSFSLSDSSTELTTITVGSSSNPLMGNGNPCVVNLTAGEKYLITVSGGSTSKWTVYYSVAPTYNINVVPNDSGVIRIYNTGLAEITSAASGEQVLIGVTPNSGRVFKSISVIWDDEEQTVNQISADNVDDAYLFHLSAMPSNEITVSATFANEITITTLDEWNAFAESVNDGNTYEGATVLLGADISGVTASAGTPDHPFKGTFNGQSHTLNVNLSSADSEYVAPFGAIDGAVIQNTTVRGSVTGSAYSAGLVGHVAGTSAVVLNKVYTDVTASGSSGPHYIGGIIGNAGSSELSVVGNVFEGSLTTDSFAGGIIGWGEGYAIVIAQNLFNGSYSGNGCQFYPIALNNAETLVVIRTEASNYYTVPASDAFPEDYAAVTGNYILLELPDDESTAPFCRGNSFDPFIAGLGYDSFYAVSDLEFTINDKTINTAFSEPVVKVLGNYSRYLTTDYFDYVYMKDGQVVETPTTAGYYTVVITGKGKETNASDAVFYGTASYTFAVTSGTIGGDGTAAYPYAIKNAEDWNTLAELIDMGNEDYYSDDYSIYYELLNDITVTRSIGKLVTGTDNDNAYRFSGNFDGKGHTITFNADATGSNFAPFSQAVYANFSNLTVTGTISTSYDGTAGIVGNTNGKCSFTNCTSDVDIVVTGNRECIGGFVGIGGSAGTDFDSCLFTGSITGTAVKNKRGGFVGFTNGPVTFTNCVADLDEDYNSYHYAFVTGSSDRTFTSSYYVDSSDICGLDQGIKAYGSAPSGLLYGIKTVATGNINLSTNQPVYSNEIYIPAVYTGFKTGVYSVSEAVDVQLYGTDDELMTEGSDYTVVDEVTDSTGEYDVHTLTYTAVSGSGYAGEETKEYLREKAVKNVTVTEIDMNGNASAAKEVNIYEYVAPSVYYDGYTFSGWKVNDGELLATQDAVREAILDSGEDEATVQSVYAKNDNVFQLKVVNGTIKDTDYTLGNIAVSSQVFVEADAAPAGYVFSHWTIKYGSDNFTRIVGYETIYAFRMPNAEVTLEAVYAADETIKTGVAYLESYYKSGDNKLSFVSVSTVPVGCTILRAGVVANTEAELNGQPLTIATTKYASYNSTTCSNYNSYKFTFTKSDVSADDVWCVRAFLEYEDAQGTHVVYGDMVSVSLAHFAQEEVE